jgi:hypothetical protein
VDFPTRIGAGGVTLDRAVARLRAGSFRPPDWLDSSHNLTGRHAKVGTAEKQGRWATKGALIGLLTMPNPWEH